MDKLNEVIKNKQRKYEEGVGDCTQILGSETELVRVAELYAENFDLIHLITTAQIVKFCEDHSFSRDEFDAFKLGALSIGAFLQKSFLEYQKTVEEKKNLTKKKSSLT